MWSSLFKARGPSTREEKLAAAMGQIDVQIVAQEQVAVMQSDMADAYRTRARTSLQGGNRRGAIQYMRRAASCEAQVSHIEAVINSSTAQRQALELSAVHTASARAVESTRDALAAKPLDADLLNAAMDDVQDLIGGVQLTQDAFSTFASDETHETDDDLLAALELELNPPVAGNAAPPAVAAPPAATALALPSVPTSHPTTAANPRPPPAADVGLLLQFTSA